MVKFHTATAPVAAAAPKLMKVSVRSDPPGGVSASDQVFDAEQATLEAEFDEDTIPAEIRLAFQSLLSGLRSESSEPQGSHLACSFVVDVVVDLDIHRQGIRQGHSAPATGRVDRLRSPRRHRYRAQHGPARSQSRGFADGAFDAFDMGAFDEFERALIRERQREGIVLAKQRGAYRGRKKSLSPETAAAELRSRAAAGDKPAHIARNFGISQETVYQYLKDTELCFRWKRQLAGLQ